MLVGLTYDLRDDYQEDDTNDLYAEFDSKETIEDIRAAIESGGHQTVLIGNFRSLLDYIQAKKRVDIVFNIAEGLKGRNRESQVPMLLEMYNIPYVGSDALTMGLTLDKVIAKKIFIYHGLPTPNFVVAQDLEDIEDESLPFPLFVKPRYEGTSKGLTDDALVRDRAALDMRVKNIINKYNQPALIEEFISGQEFTVAVIGNDPPIALPPVQVTINDSIELGDRFYSYEMVESSDLQYICPARAPEKMIKELKRIAVEGYMALDCRDFSRLDFRVDPKGNIYLLECNPLPSLSQLDVFPLASKEAGSDYNRIINQIINYAIIRQNIKQSGTK